MLTTTQEDISDTDSQGFQFHINTYLLHLKATSLNKNWILLDNQSTVDIFFNADLLKKIRKSSTKMTTVTNAGSNTTDLRDVYDALPIFVDIT